VAAWTLHGLARLRRALCTFEVLWHVICARVYRPGASRRVALSALVLTPSSAAPAPASPHGLIARLPVRFWGEGLSYLRHVIVRSPSSSIPTDTTPYEMAHKRKPDYSPLLVVGCRACVHIQRKERKSLQDHAKPCVFLGCPENIKGWKLWDLSANGGRGGVIVPCDIVWIEDTFLGTPRFAHDAIPERFGRPAEPGDAKPSLDEQEVSDSTESEGVGTPLPCELAAPPSDSDSSSSSLRSSSTASPTPSSPPRTPPRPAAALAPPRTPPQATASVSIGACGRMDSAWTGGPVVRTMCFRTL
jgi:hypothetical protein